MYFSHLIDDGPSHGALNHSSVETNLANSIEGLYWLTAPFIGYALGSLSEGFPMQYEQLRYHISITSDVSSARLLDFARSAFFNSILGDY